MLLHLRVTVPPERLAAVRALFEDCRGTAHVAVLPGRRAIGHSAAATLVVRFAVAIVVAALVALVGRGLGWFAAAHLPGDRPATGFITAPDRWWVVVAVLAGIGAMLSLPST